MARSTRERRFVEKPDRSEDTYGHFHAHFPKSNDPILLILRGHLLVEQQLTLLRPGLPRLLVA